MVFWSGFVRKIKETVSKKEFKSLETTVTKNTSDIALKANKTYVDSELNKKADKTYVNDIKSSVDTNTTDIYNNSQKINKTEQDINAITTKLNNETFIDYKGEYNQSTTYALSDSVSSGDKWYISKQNNNIGHTPPSAGDDAWWLQINQPSINANDFVMKTMMNSFFCVNSIVMTVDGTEHALVAMFPGKLQELTDNDIAYLAIGNNSSNSSLKYVELFNLPNLSFSFASLKGRYRSDTWLVDGGYLLKQTTPSTTVNNAAEQYGQSNAPYDLFTFYLNGNQQHQPLNIQPKTLKVRVWKIVQKLY